MSIKHLTVSSPRFKSRHGKQSLIYPQNVKLAENKIYFPKLDWIKAVIHRPVKGSIRTVTITKNCAEQYYASVMFEDGRKKPLPNAKGKAIDRFFPSSKTCHVCLNQVGSLPLDVRNWTCNNCNTTHDRDINAAISLRDEGLRLLTCGTRDQAYCPDVRPSSGGRKKSTTRQSVG